MKNALTRPLSLFVSSPHQKWDLGPARLLLGELLSAPKKFACYVVHFSSRVLSSVPSERERETHLHARPGSIKKVRLTDRQTSPAREGATEKDELSLFITDFPAYSDTLGTREKCHCKRGVTVTTSFFIHEGPIGNC